MNRKQKTRQVFSLTRAATLMIVSVPIGTVFAADINPQKRPTRTESRILLKHDWRDHELKPDGLGTYEENLSAFGMSARLAPESGASGDPVVSRHTTRAGPVTLNGADLRSVLDVREFARVDDLGTYDEDLSEFGAGTEAQRIVPSRGPDTPITAAARSPKAHGVGRPSHTPTRLGQDMLGTYMEDLSAFGASARLGVATEDRSGTAVAGHEDRARGRTVDVVALRAWIRSSGATGVDGLGAYMEDWSRLSVAGSTAPASPATATRSLVEQSSDLHENRELVAASVAAPLGGDRATSTNR